MTACQVSDFIDIDLSIYGINKRWKNVEGSKNEFKGI